MATATPPQKTPTAADATTERTTVTESTKTFYEQRKVHRALPLLVGALGLGGLSTANLTWNRSNVEDTLTEKATEALQGAGFPDVAVELNGRDALLTGRVASTDDIERARVIVRNRVGIRHAEAHLDTTGGTAAATGATATGTPLDLTASVEGGRVVLQGKVANEADRNRLLAQAEAAFGKGQVLDRLTIDVATGSQGIGTFGALIGQLKDKGGPKLRLSGDTATLSGAVGTEADKASLATAVATAMGSAAKVENQLTVTPSSTTAAPTTTPAPATTAAPAATAVPIPAAPPPVPVAKPVLPVIFFPSDLSLPDAEGVLLLDQAASVLKANPTLRVEIDGHTDGVGSVSFNNSLSQRRAETVLNALVDRGIDATRMTAVGNGSAVSAAPNDTADNRTKNRRVDFKVL